MFPDFSSTLNPFFNLYPGFPPDYKGLVLRGASVQTASGKYGTIVMQEISTGDLSIELSSFHFQRKITVPFKPNNFFLNAPVALQNLFLFRSKDFKNVQLKQSQYFFLHSAGRTCEAVFEKGKDYLLFNVGYPETAIEEISAVFPELFSNFFNKLKEGKAFAFTRPARMPAAVKKITQEIIESPYQGKPKEYIFDKKIKESLCVLLLKHDSITKKITDPSLTEIEKLNRIANLLISDVRIHHPISELGRKTEMNETKLQAMFFKLFGKTIYKFQRAAKLERARRQIQDEHRSIKYAAIDAGYKSSTAFETEFKKHFGFTPGSLLKKN
jgi:AraC family transcriptional regulator, transcriptional activator of the genes for pyochelin and ferripyochelin receptors